LDEYASEPDAPLLVMHSSQMPKFSMNVDSLSQSSDVFPSISGSRAATLQSLKHTLGMSVMSALFVFLAASKSHKDMSRLLLVATGPSVNWKIE
jgi:hypothetical protein